MAVTRLLLDVRRGATVAALLGALVETGASVARIEQDLASLGPGAVPIALRSATGGSTVRLHAPPGAAPVRPWGEQRDRLALLAVDATVAAAAVGTLELLARARAAVHGVPVAEVEQDPMAGLDETAGAVALASALASLGRPEVLVTAVGVGAGSVATARGRLALPGPVAGALLGDRRTVRLPSGVDVVEPLAVAFLGAVGVEVAEEEESALLAGAVGGPVRGGRGLLTTRDGDAGTVVAVAVPADDTGTPGRGPGLATA